MTKRIPVTQCLECGTTLSGIGDLEKGDGRGHVPGDPVACIRCGAVATVDGAGALRPFTEAEAHALTSDAEWCAALARMVRSIHLLKHQTN